VRQSAYTSRSLAPPSSNPADIYRQLKEEVSRGDTHGSKITAVRTVLVALATQWLSDGEVTSEEAADITYLADKAGCLAFRPLLYIIPFGVVQSRVEPVPVDQRANPLAPEYRIKDLHRDEFDIVEL
jgi:hypothetical protein